MENSVADVLHNLCPSEEDAKRLGHVDMSLSQRHSGQWACSDGKHCRQLYALGFGRMQLRLAVGFSAFCSEVASHQSPNSCTPCSKHDIDLTTIAPSVRAQGSV